MIDTAWCLKSQSGVRTTYMYGMIHFNFIIPKEKTFDIITVVYQVLTRNFRDGQIDTRFVNLD